MSERWSAYAAVKIVERVVVEGKLILLRPAHLGDGLGSKNTMKLLLDSLEARPLLTGASLAGALRNALREREHGYGQVERKDSATALLFGGVLGDDTGDHTRLIVDDALGEGVAISRDGVKIDPKSRTASDTALYSLELWDAGTSFELRFELAIREGDNAAGLKTALAIALDSLARGEIALGARKRRGFGQVQVEDWRTHAYNFQTHSGLMDWLRNGGQRLTDTPQCSIFAALNMPNQFRDERRAAMLTATFRLESSLLIRQKAKTSDADKANPDFIYLRDSSDTPILSGTSLGGALRARALKIAQTVQNSARAQALIDGMFGSRPAAMESEANLVASRLTVAETCIDGGIRNQVQARVSIDRFTGGALDTALFSEQPLFGSDDCRLAVALHLRNPQNHEIGLLLLLLKDLWTGDLPLGGESSIGRGRLCGETAALTLADGGWEFNAHGESVVVDRDRSALQVKYVDALCNYLEGTN